MPAPVQITHDEVAQAAAELLAQGKRITGWTLNRHLGGGRPDRLASIYAEQQAAAAQAPEVQAAPVLPLPGALEDALATGTERLASAYGVLATELEKMTRLAWSTAHDTAERRISEEAKAAHVRVTELEQDQADAQDVVVGLEDKNAALEQALADLRAELDATKTIAEERARAVTGAEARAEAAEAESRRWSEMLREAFARLPTPPALLGEERAPQAADPHQARELAGTH